MHDLDIGMKTAGPRQLDRRQDNLIEVSEIVSHALVSFQREVTLPHPATNPCRSLSGVTQKRRMHGVRDGGMGSGDLIPLAVR
ncbi:hypothetical protein GCM10018779_51790 [Streptomyces griseocarneus]|nr:hypothetical protein GCM10018779_51790 [Streptomyces griseocarneus]